MRKNLSKEPVVKDLYDYIFDKSGKKVRASISLISSHGMNKNKQKIVRPRNSPLMPSKSIPVNK